MADYTFEDENGVIRVELSEVKKGSGLGYTEASDKEKADDAGKEDKAFNNALATVKRAALRVGDMLTTLDDNAGERELSKVELEFGLTLKTDANVFIARAGMDTQIAVKLTWEKPKSQG
jgi:hypothetical protein